MDRVATKTAWLQVIRDFITQAGAFDMYKSQRISPVVYLHLQKLLETPRWKEGEKQVTGTSCVSAPEGAVLPFFCSKADCFHRRWRFSLASCHSNSDGMSGGGVSLALRSLFFLPDRRCEVWLSAGCALGGGRRSAFDAAEETLEGLRSDEARSRRCLFHLRQH